jgi:CRISPR-associated protein (TIGR03985 family)
MTTALQGVPDPKLLNSVKPFSPHDNDDGNNLGKAIRIWYSLRELAGEFTQTHHQFTDREWRIHLYEAANNNRDKFPQQLSDCIASKHIPDILFGADPQQANKWQAWRKSFIECYRPSHGQQEIDDYLDQIDSLLPSYVTGKTILNDLRYLRDIGYLQEVDNNTFQLAEDAPQVVGTTSIQVYSPDIDNSIFLAEDFDSYQQCFAMPIRDIRRFYIHTDYRSLGQSQDSSLAIQRQLQQVWEQPLTSPVKLKYHSASQCKILEVIVYPLLIHYYQRAFYLCACDQLGVDQKGWHNYRIDRIEQISNLAWSDPAVHKNLSEKFMAGDDQGQIDEVQEAWESAYGCDFYQPDKVMILRFDRDFHDRYIQKTFRHQTFKEVPHDQIDRLLKDRKASAPETKTVVERRQAYPQDAYYKMAYRVHDHSVLMRLRAWSPNVEVLFPQDLRQRMAADIHRAAGFYDPDHPHPQPLSH